MLTPQQYAEIAEQFRRGCVFCDPDPRLIVATSKRFRVCLDAAPLVPGHLILHSDRHLGCAGEVPEAWYEELDALRRSVRAQLEERYGRVISYEHGRAGHCLSDGPEHRLCHHFHLHFVPADVDVTGDLHRRFKHIPVDDYRTIPRLYEDYGDYLYFEASDRSMGYFPVDTAIERHLMRTLIAAATGSPERADWRAYRDADLLVTGLTEFSARPLEPYHAPKPQGATL
ncbi:hypothetical protein [Kitasatospora sp. NPDC058046]|uniref:hypothetical protein n=1 Tax=Kitasatospora sp. NPDC058046 TaxID=3346312 RepID=UPI0036DCD44D